MNYSEAVKNLEGGKCCARKGIIDHYLMIAPLQNYIWQVNGSPRTPAVNVTIYTPSIEDMDANDWIVKF